MKRAFDIFLGCLAALILLVPVLLVALAVRLTSKGPALYWSDRVGRNNVIFKMPKSSSMRVGNQQDLIALRTQQGVHTLLKPFRRDGVSYQCLCVTA